MTNGLKINLFWNMRISEKMEDGFEAKKVQTVFSHLNEKYFLPKKNSDEILKENTQKRFNNSCLVRPMCYIVRVLNESLSWKEFSSEF